MHLSATTYIPFGQMSLYKNSSNWYASKYPQTQLPLAEYNCLVITALPSPDSHCPVRTASAKPYCLCQVLLPLHNIIASAKFCCFYPVMTNFAESWLAFFVHNNYSAFRHFFASVLHLLQSIIILNICHLVKACLCHLEWHRCKVPPHINHVCVEGLGL